jgi:sarcosine oxidase
MQNYDVIVIGCGGVGSATLYQLAREGVRALGIEQFGIAHERGSSHGQTRIIRQAYFEHPDYVPLLRMAYAAWGKLEQQSGRKLFHRIGLLEVGPADGALIPGVLESARRHNLAIETFNAAEVALRFPGFRAPQDAVAVFEENAGYLLVEEAVRAQLDCARNCGAELRTGQTVRAWRVEGDTVCVDCEQESFSAARLIVTTGAWSASLLRPFGVNLRVVPKHLHWYANESTNYRDGSPVFFYEIPRGYFYGFPQLDERGVKIGEHSGGDEVSDPLKVARGVDPEDRRRTIEFLCDYLPQVSHRAEDHTVCFYTFSPDNHFIVDRHPEYENVAFAAGLSGHGFKFAPVLGQVLSDFALRGSTDLPVAFLSLNRFPGSLPKFSNG